MAKLLPKNQFLPFTHGSLKAMWTADVAGFAGLIDPATIPARGVDETTLLEWFGERESRIALLAFALTGYPPTHVVREFSIGSFITDFAWANIQPDTKPVFGFVEFEHAKEDTLFKQKSRTVPYIGPSFLNGFSQLVDWCSFGQTEAEKSPQISKLLNGHKHAAKMKTQFALIAGLDCFAATPMSVRRREWWEANIKLGHATHTKSYTEVCEDAEQRLVYLK